MPLLEVTDKTDDYPRCFKSNYQFSQQDGEPPWHFSGWNDENHVHTKYKTIVVSSQLPWSVITKKFCNVTYIVKVTTFSM
jgi:hypothetical protein